MILDADESAERAFALVQRSLKKVIGVDIPAQNVWVPGAPGKRTKFGVFIAGDPSAGTGEIETLAWLSWAGRAENHPLRDCVSSYLDCARRAGRQLHSPDKARVNTLLAVIHDEDPRLGPAARANVFDLEAAELAQLRAFLAEM